MKKLLGLTLIIVLGLCVVGCASTNDITPTEPEDKIEQPEKDEEKELIRNNMTGEEETVLTMDDDEFKTAMTSTLSDKEYDEYFKSLAGRTIEFDGSLLAIDKLEGKDTRYELMIGSGDYNETTSMGPVMKVKDTAYGDGLNESVTEVGQNVKVRAVVYFYDMDNSYLEINPVSIDVR